MYRWLIFPLVLFAFPWNAATAQATTPAAKAEPSQTPQISPLLNNDPPAVPAQSFKREDWTTLSLDKSNLPLAHDGGPVISKIEGSGYTRELLRLQWRPADPIDLYVVLPKGVKSPPVILYLYDYTSDISRFRDDGWCNRMTKNGFAAVGFSSALSNQRIHAPRPMKEWFVSQLQEALASSTHDVEMILNYLETRQDLDMKRVGMFGQGSGGSIAILAAAADPRIKAIDVMDPWGDWPDWLKASQQVPDEERALYLSPEFLGKVRNLDPVIYLPQLGAKAIRIEQTLDDPVTPEIARDRLKAKAPKPEDVVRYKDWGTFQSTYRETSLCAWLQERLKSQVPASMDGAAAGSREQSGGK